MQKVRTKYVSREPAPAGEREGEDPSLGHVGVGHELDVVPYDTGSGKRIDVVVVEAADVHIPQRQRYSVGHMWVEGQTEQPLHITSVISNNLSDVALRRSPRYLQCVGQEGQLDHTVTVLTPSAGGRDRNGGRGGSWLWKKGEGLSQFN